MQSFPVLVPVTTLLLIGALGAQSDAAVPAQIPTPVDAATAAAIKQEGLERSQAMAILRDLTSHGHRLTGSDNFTAACDWAVQQFQKFGLQNVHKEKWGEWKLVWNHGPWVGRIVEPIQLDMYVATEAWTAGTKGLVRSNIVRIPANVDEVAQLGGKLKGAFVYSGGRKARGEVRTACEQAGIAGWVYMAIGDAKYPTRVRVFGNHRIAMGSIDDVAARGTARCRQARARRVRHPQRVQARTHRTRQRRRRDPGHREAR
jgi:hypothetical protein